MVWVRFFFICPRGRGGAVRFLEICADIFEMGVGDTNLLWVCGWGVFVCGVGGWRGGEGVRFWNFSLNLLYN